MLNEDDDEGDVDEDPMTGWYENLEEFPYCHFFFDKFFAEEATDLGPWLCIHGVYGASHEIVEIKCGMYEQ